MAEAMTYKRKDHYYQRAKREGKASRAVYKLSELQKRFDLIKPGNTVIDLGAAPGVWMKELGTMVGPKGRVIGIDLLSLKIGLPPHCHFIQGSLTDESARLELAARSGGKVDAILSDMSPNLSGIAFADAYRSYELACVALETARSLLKPGGHLVVKIFPGDELQALLQDLRSSFQKVASVIPDATRKTSSERYLVATGFRG